MQKKAHLPIDFIGKTCYNPINIYDWWAIKNEINLYRIAKTQLPLWTNVPMLLIVFITYNLII